LGEEIAMRSAPNHIRMTWRFPLAILVAAAATALMAPPASAQLAQAAAGVNAGHPTGCDFTPLQIPNVGNTLGFVSVPDPPGTYATCLPESPNSGLQTNTGSSGSISATFLATATSNGPTTYQGNANAVADLATQTVGASASGTTTIIGNFGSDHAGAYGEIGETITPMSASNPTGTGSIKIQFTVTGQISQTFGTAMTALDIGVGGQTSEPFFASDALLAPNGGVPTVTYDGVTSTTGYTTTLGAGGVTVDFDATFLSSAIPITFGQATSFFESLQANAGPQTESSSTGTSTTDFLNTATITGIEMFNAAGAPVTDFTIDTNAGVELGPNGVITQSGGPPPSVPEPATLSLFAAGLGMLGLCRRRKIHGRSN
jgi:hypothetical protein